MKLDTKIKEKLKYNVKIDYLYCFLKNFDVSSAIWVLYLVYKGLPLWQIGIIEGVFHISSLIFEVPSGALADLAGRKRVLFLGRIISVISTIIMLFSSRLWQFCIGFVAAALSYNLNSGSEEALVYDSLKFAGEEERYIKVNGRENMIIEIASGAALFLGGILAEYSFEMCYLFSLFVGIITIVSAVFFTEPPITEKKERISLKRHFKETITVIKENPKVIKILLYYPLVEAFYAVVFFYGQQYFAEFGYNKIQIGIIMLAAGMISCFGALSSEKVLEHLGTKTKYMVSVVMGLGIFLTGLAQKELAIIAFLAASYVNSMVYPIASSALNEQIPSKHRATIISVNSMCFSLAMICFFPVAGWIGDVYGLRVAFFLLGLTELLMTVIVLWKSR